MHCFYRFSYCIRYPRHFSVSHSPSMWDLCRSAMSPAGHLGSLGSGGSPRWLTVYSAGWFPPFPICSSQSAKVVYSGSVILVV